MAVEQKSKVLREQSTERLRIVSNSREEEEKSPFPLDAVVYRLNNGSSASSQKWKRQDDHPFRYKLRPPPIDW